MSAIEDLTYGLSLSGQDPAAIGAALARFWSAVLRDPVLVAQTSFRGARTQAAIAASVAGQYLGAEPRSAPASGDRRFADRAWRENPLLRGIMETYLAGSRSWLELLDRCDLDPATRRKAGFGLRMLADALAPTNLPWLNPSVVKEAIDTGGLSLARGLQNLVHDLVWNGGRPRQVDTSGFELGRNLAATPGRVVLRNRLIELLAYEPTTRTTFRLPMLCSPPWINKYYVMDLAPSRSFIEYAVAHGFQVFCISYRNPDASLGGLSMDDYLREGLLAALDRVAEITRAPAVNLFGLCLGGTYAGISLAYLAARGEAGRVGWAAVTNTLMDFSEPGDLGAFTDEETVARLERRMGRKGYLEAAALQRTFDWLRGNDLVWSYVVSNWYMGRQPPAFDVLAWNADSTNLPAVMHAQYLRTCYLENRLARGQLQVDGTRLDLKAVRTPMYVLGAEADHIAPWPSVYRTTQLVGGEVRFTLTSSGHIAGIVNPPGSPRARCWTGDGCPPTSAQWRAGASQRQGSWWEDWLEWASRRSGDRVRPRRLPAGEPAPGRYVRGEVGPAIPPG